MSTCYYSYCKDTWLNQPADIISHWTELCEIMKQEKHVVTGGEVGLKKKNKNEIKSDSEKMFWLRRLH